MTMRTKNRLTVSAMLRGVDRCDQLSPKTHARAHLPNLR
jgi:hypothetical protein